MRKSKRFLTALCAVVMACSTLAVPVGAYDNGYIDNELDCSWRDDSYHFYTWILRKGSRIGRVVAIYDDYTFGDTARTDIDNILCYKPYHRTSTISGSRTACDNYRQSVFKHTGKTLNIPSWRNDAKFWGWLIPTD